MTHEAAWSLKDGYQIYGPLTTLPAPGNHLDKRRSPQQSRAATHGNNTKGSVACNIYGDISSFLNAFSAVRCPPITSTPVMKFLFHPKSSTFSATLLRVERSVGRGREVIVIYYLTQFSQLIYRSHYEAFYFYLWPGVDTWETQFPRYLSICLFDTFIIKDTIRPSP